MLTVTEIFNGVAERYDRWFTSPIGRYVDRVEWELFLKKMNPQRGEKALDVGCGTGIYLIRLARMGLSCTGIDPSERMLHIARKKAEAAGLQIEFVKGFAESLPFPDSSFDLVFSITAMEFFGDPQAAVKEMMRVAKEGGRVGIGVLNIFSTWGIRRKVRDLIKNGLFKEAHLFSPGEFKKVAPFEEVVGGVLLPHSTPPPLIPPLSKMEEKLLGAFPRLGYLGAYLFGHFYVRK